MRVNSPDELEELLRSMLPTVHGNLGSAVKLEVKEKESESVPELSQEQTQEITGAVDDFFADQKDKGSHFKDDHLLDLHSLPESSPEAPPVSSPEAPEDVPPMLSGSSPDTPPLEDLTITSFARSRDEIAERMRQQTDRLRRVQRQSDLYEPIFIASDKNEASEILRERKHVLVNAVSDGKFGGLKFILVRKEYLA